MESNSHLLDYVLFHEPKMRPKILRVPSISMNFPWKQYLFLSFSQLPTSLIFRVKQPIFPFFSSENSISRIFCEYNQFFPFLSYTVWKCQYFSPTSFTHSLSILREITWKKFFLSKNCKMTKMKMLLLGILRQIPDF